MPRVREVPSSSVNPLTGALSPTYIRFLTQQKALQQVAAVSGAGAAVVEVGGQWFRRWCVPAGRVSAGAT